MLLLKLNKLKAERFRKIDYILATGIVNKDVWLAGGALRTLIDQNETICDYDLFFREVNTPHKSNVRIVQEKLIALGFKLTYQCPEGKLFTYEKTEITPIYTLRQPPPPNKITKVQLVTEHFYYSPEELLSSFDLSPTYFCTDGEYLWTSRQAIRSVKKKVCSLLKLSYPVSTLHRIIKYCGKGYSCIPAIETYVGSLLDSNREVFTSESMRRYID